jgi:hypothetical protein
MSHVDPDLLALAALGEAVPDDARDHLAICDECREERDAYARAVGAGRAVRPDDLDLPAPPVAVWEGISAQLGLSDAGGSPAPSTASVTAIGDTARSKTRRSGRTRWLWAVAAAIVVIVATAGIVSLARRDDGDAKAVQEVALTEVDESGARGSAALVRDGNGYALRVDTTGLTNRDGTYYELWLMNPDTNSFVSLGPVLPGTRSTHPLPAGVTTKTDPFVDISVEPLDGDPAHSTVSVLRGNFA